MIKRGYAAILLPLVISTSMGPCYGQNVIAADNATGQPTVRRDSEGFSSCGVRVVVALLNAKHIEMYDFSVNVDASIYRGTMKGGKYTIARGPNSALNIEKRKVVLPDPVQFWIVEQSADIPLRPERLGKSDTPGFALGVSDFSQSATMVYALAVGKPIQFAMRYPADRMDRVVSIKVEMQKSDVDAVFDCMDGLSRRIQREVEKDEAKK